MKKNMLLIIADSARADIFEQLLHAGELPNIKQHVVQRGCYRRIISAFPTTTGPAHIPILTGRHPGNADVPGYRWFDRAALKNNKKKERYLRSYNSLSGLRLHRDIAPDTASLYEYFEKPAMVLEPFNLCRHTKLKQFKLGKIWHMVTAHYTRNWEPVDNYVQKKTAQLIKKGHDCITSVFFTIDEHAHLHGTLAQKTLTSYRTIDSHIGQLCKTLKEEGRYDQTDIILTSDHGHSDTHTHISLIQITEKCGYNTIFFPKIYKKKGDCAVMESGNAMAHIYLKSGTDWQHNVTLKQIQKDQRGKILLNALLVHPGISLIAARTKNGIIILGKEGSLRVEHQPKQCLRINTEGTNPLASSLTDGIYTRENLLQNSFHEPFPDAIWQLKTIFQSQRSGDLVVVAANGFDLRKEYEHPEHKASHGSLWHEHMHVPFASTINFIEDYFSTVDLLPTLLHRENIELPAGLDGRAIKTENCSG